MKRIVILIIVGIYSLNCLSQEVTDNQLKDFVDYLRLKKIEEVDIKKIISNMTDDPELYNSFWKSLIDKTTKEESTKWDLLKDLNVQFKTFQATGDQPAALGFTYDFNFDYTKFSDNDRYRNSHSLELTAKGNVSLNKLLNPTDFLETRVSYRWANFSGGVIRSRDDTAVFRRLNRLDDELIKIKDIKSKQASDLLNKFSDNLVLSNQFYYSVAPKFSLESNQDFSKIQFVPGLLIDLGAKAWKENNTLSMFNILDYPFALLRLLTGTEKTFTVYGSTLPTIQLSLDYIIPSSDTLREKLTGDLKPYTRFKFETSFRTFIAKIDKENIFLNANYRYYHEINAPKVIKESDMLSHSYLVIALQSSSGFYISYANGKLPFDVKSDEVYSIGFNYKFSL